MGCGTESRRNVAISYISRHFKGYWSERYTMRRLTGTIRLRKFRAVDGVSFELHEGDNAGDIGSNGAGKSTLLKAVAGIWSQHHGRRK